MKYIFKYIIFFFLSLRRDKQYIILNPNLSFLGLKKFLYLIKKKKNFLIIKFVTNMILLLLRNLLPRML